MRTRCAPQALAGSLPPYAPRLWRSTLTLILQPQATWADRAAAWKVQFTAMALTAAAASAPATVDPTPQPLPRRAWWDLPAVKAGAGGGDSCAAGTNPSCGGVTSSGLPCSKAGDGARASGSGEAMTNPGCGAVAKGCWTEHTAPADGRK